MIDVKMASDNTNLAVVWYPAVRALALINSTFDTVSVCVLFAPMRMAVPESSILRWLICERDKSVSSNRSIVAPEEVPVVKVVKIIRSEVVPLATIAPCTKISYVPVYSILTPASMVKVTPEGIWMFPVT